MVILLIIIIFILYYKNKVRELALNTNGWFIIILFILAIIGGSTVCYVIDSFATSNWWGFIPSLLTTFFGVLAAFGLTRWWEHRQDGYNRRKVLELIKDELGKCSDHQETPAGNLMPTEFWDAIVNSGRSMLLDDMMLSTYKADFTALATVYSAIKMCNYEAMGVNRFREAWQLSCESPTYGVLHQKWEEKGDIFRRNTYCPTIDKINSALKCIECALKDC